MHGQSSEKGWNGGLGMEKGKKMSKSLPASFCALLVVGFKKQVGAAKLWLVSRCCQ